VQGYVVNYLKPEWRVLDPGLRPDFEALAKVRGGVMLPVSRDFADRHWVVQYYDDVGPAAFYLWDRSTRRAELLFVDVPELTKYTFAPMQPITLRSRDGHDIPCYLTLPVGVPAKKLPFIIHPHGGPWARDEWGFAVDVQWLANRGYAVLQPQFRGSTGFGVAWINASIGEVGDGAMTNDLTDCVRWAIREGIADSTRVGIYGGSYGGYVTLCGLAFTPQLYACGVDEVGPSSLRTTIESFPPYWKARRKRWLLRMGDVLSDSVLNQRVSPLYHTDRMHAPLLIGHGVNDPRVKIVESERITAALRKRGVPVTFVVYPDEGHGFARPETNQDFSGRMEDFLSKYLHGRAEPWKKIEGSSAEVR
jgi:dipeptidyl aminopeptidase/acylaminoacyl peptidase